MQHLTAIITHEQPSGHYEALALDLPLPVITGRSLSEVRDNLLTALQRHIDAACEEEAGAAASPSRTSRPSAATIALKTAIARRGDGLILEIPVELLTRN